MGFSRKYYLFYMFKKINYIKTKKFFVLSVLIIFHDFFRFLLFF